MLAAFRAAIAEHGAPASTLTDNGMVFTTRLSGGKGGRNGLETELRRLGITQKNGKPEPPSDPGQSRAIPADTQEVAPRPEPPARHPRPAPGPPRRIHHPVQPAPAAQVPAAPGHPRHRLQRPAQSHPRRPRQRHPRPRPPDKVGTTGTVTLRHAGRLHHIGIGRDYAGTRVLLLVQDLHIRIINAATGELLRELTLDPAKNYQPTGKPPGPAPKTP